jgi:hypothetical protein
VIPRPEALRTSPAAGAAARGAAPQRQVQKDPNWSNTSALIDEMLRLSTATRRTATSAGDRP